MEQTNSEKADSKTYHQMYFQEHRDQWKEYSRRDWEKNKEAITKKRNEPEARARRLAYLKKWRANNVEKRRQAMKDWYLKNPEHRKQYRASYAKRRLELYQQQRERICAQKRAAAPKYLKRVQAYQRKQRRENIQFCLKDRLRVTMGRALRRQFVKKSKRTFELIGCTPTELKAHIEGKFLPGMTWANRNLWHVDHKRPLDSFDLRDTEQQRLAFHFTNLQPLWAGDNHRKSSKWSG